LIVPKQSICAIFPGSGKYLLTDLKCAVFFGNQRSPSTGVPLHLIALNSILSVPLCLISWTGCTAPPRLRQISWWLMIRCLPQICTFLWVNQNLWSYYSFCWCVAINDVCRVQWSWFCFEWPSPSMGSDLQNVLTDTLAWVLKLVRDRSSWLLGSDLVCLH